MSFYRTPQKSEHKKYMFMMMEVMAAQVTLLFRTLSFLLPLRLARHFFDGSNFAQMFSTETQ